MNSQILRILKPDFQNHPENILHVIIWIALISIAAILTLSGIVVHRIISEEIARDARESAIQASKAVFEQQRDILTTVGNDGELHLYLAQADFPVADRYFRTYLNNFGILKVKIYNIQKEVIYSTDKKIIGRIDSDNKRLDRVFQGNVDSHLEMKDRMLDLAEENKFNVEVVETYIPIRERDRIIGSFEIYTDVTPYRQEISQIVAKVLAWLAAILLFVFACSYLLIRKATIVLKKTQQELAERTSLFQTLSDFATESIFWEKPDGGLHYVSPACELITGYTPADFSNDAGLMERLVHHSDRELWDNHKSEAHLTGKNRDQTPIEFRIVTRGGQQRWISHVCRPIYDSSGVFLGVRGSNADITEKKEAERVIADKIVQLEDALANVKQLEGIIPICMHCKKIRDDKKSWHQLELYITNHSEARFSHGICPECYEEQMNQLRRSRT